jgi:hypothetical protein
MSSPKLAHELEGRWQERSFARELRFGSTQGIEIQSG